MIKYFFCLCISVFGFAQKNVDAHPIDSSKVANESKSLVAKGFIIPACFKFENDLTLLNRCNNDWILFHLRDYLYINPTQEIKIHINFIVNSQGLFVLDDIPTEKPI